MTPQEIAIKKIELYSAFVAGKAIQIKFKFLEDNERTHEWRNWIGKECPDFFSCAIDEWRVKPETKKMWYRVALAKDPNNQKTFWFAVNESTEMAIKESNNFIEWITDRVYVEVESE